MSREVLRGLVAVTTDRGERRQPRLRSGARSTQDRAGRVTRILGVLSLCVVSAALASAGTVSGGSDHSLALKTDTTVIASGANVSGQLGDGTTTQQSSPVAVVDTAGTGTLSGIVAVAAGTQLSVALDDDGYVYTWGSNTNGQLGLGTTDANAHATPAQVSGLTGIVAVAAGQHFVLALKNDGTVWAWGLNSNGQLGDATTTQRTSPVQVKDSSGSGTLTDIVAIAAGGTHGLALDSAGHVWAWGNNASGQIGVNNVTTPQTTPQQVLGTGGSGALSGIVAIAGGGAHSLAADSSGNAWAWGDNGQGQIGINSTTTPQTTPQQVKGTGGTGFLSGIVAVAGGDTHSLALASSGSAWAWGDNGNGQVGINNTTSPQTTPQQVMGVGGSGFLTSVQAIGAGANHCLAVTGTTPAGTGYAWGNNTSGRLGDGTTTQRTAPVAINGTGFTWPAAAPTFNPVGGAYNNDQTVALSSATPSATIRYTLGASPLDPGPGDTSATSVSITGTATLKAKAWATDYAPSAVSRASYTLTVATPSITPNGGAFASAQTVTLATATTDAFIYYTTDGSTPTPSSTVYTAPFSISTYTVLKTMAAKSGYTDSGVASATFSFNYGTAAAPVLTPGAETYTCCGLTVTMTTTTAGATIRYTTDGTNPTGASTPYTAPIAVHFSMTLKAATFHPDYTTSAITSATYTVVMATPTFSPDAGTFSAMKLVTVSSASAGASVEIHYTTNGVDPTTGDPLVATGGTVLVDRTMTLKAATFKAGCTPSSVKSAAYVVLNPVLGGGGGHSASVKSDGTVWSWGAGSNGQIGDGFTQQRPRPTQAASLSDVQAISLGDVHTLALKSAGGVTSVWAWGQNAYGQLGDNSVSPRSSPVQVKDTPGSGYLTNVVAVAAGSLHSLALKSDGTVWAWGYNAYGQLGIGATDSSAHMTPVQVKDPTGAGNLTGIVGIGAGFSHSLAIKSDGAVLAWGRNSSGQLGDGTTTSRSLPVAVVALSGVVAVRGGSDHSLALRNDGIVSAWGLNSYGSLGDGTNVATAYPVQVLGLTNVVSIGAGIYHSVAARGDGTVWSWGSNGYGQLGVGSADSLMHSPPAQIPGLSSVTSVAAGGDHTLALTSDGTVWGWGKSWYAQVGDGTTVQRTSPVQVSTSGWNWKVGTPTFSVATGTYYTDQSVTLGDATSAATIKYTTDGSDPRSSGTAQTYSTPVAIGATQTLRAYALKSGLPDSNLDSMTYTMKASTPGISATGSASTSYTVTLTCGTPCTPGVTIRYTTDGSDPTSGSTQYTSPLSITTTTTVKARSFRTGWTTSDLATATYTMNFGAAAAPVLTPGTGTYICCGQTVTMTTTTVGATIRYTTNGYTPSGSSPAYTAPIAVDSSMTLKAAAFHPDYATSTVTTATYTIKVATPSFGQAAGNYAAGTTTTVSNTTSGATIYYTINGVSPAATDPTIASGGTVVLGNFTLKAMATKSGCTSSDVASGAYTITGNVASAPPAGAGVAGNYYFSLTVKSDGTVYGWGYNYHGQLGDNATTSRNMPVQVKDTAGTGWLTGIGAIAAGYLHSVGLGSDGHVWAWGYNGYGEIGINNTTTPQKTPQQVLGAGGSGTLQNIVAIAAGNYHTVAADSSGSVWSWGYNSNGQLGDNTTTQRTAPVQVLGPGGTGYLTGIVAVAAGATHSAALRNDGTVWTWGLNTYGQLGDTTQTQRTTPVQVAGLTGVTAIAAGANHTLALRTDGMVWAWGQNGYGQLGIGTWDGVAHMVPVQVSGLAAAAWITGNSNQAMAVTTGGTVYAWGDNAVGQAGDGTTTSPRTSPVQVKGPEGVGYLTGIARAASGWAHSLAVATDGTVWAWGDNYYGEVGDGNNGNNVNRWTPVKVSEAGFAAKVATPAFNYPPSTYTSTFSVTVTDATSGASIYYSTDGSEPTTAYTSAVPVTSTTTLKAKATKAGLADSNTASALYTLKLTASLGSGSGTYEANPSLNVTVTSNKTSATIRYTTDGTDPTPTTGTAITSGQSVAVSSTLTLKAKAWLTGWADSDVASATYTMRVATPTLNPGAGSYTSTQNVTAATTTTGATLRYTTNGIEPTTTDAVVSGAITVDHSMALRVKGFKDGLTASSTTEGAYTLTLGTVQAPVLSPTPGTFTAVQEVTLTSGTSGATIRYTTDGTTPTYRSRVYSGPVTVDGDTTIKAAAYKADWTPSTTTTCNAAMGNERLPEGVAGGPWAWETGGGAATEGPEGRRKGRRDRSGSRGDVAL